MWPWNKKNAVPPLLKDDPLRLGERILVGLFMFAPGVIIGAVMIATVGSISIPPTGFQWLGLIFGGVVSGLAGFLFPRVFLAVLSVVSIGK
ncbi:MAG: hypothetical protein RIE56_05445 [Amphiplicatus sp.]